MNEAAQVTSNMISTVGFPITMCLIMLVIFGYVIVYMVKNQTKEREEWLEAINKNTEVISNNTDIIKEFISKIGG